MGLLEKILEVSSKSFNSLEDCLSYYREVLPKRTAGYHQEEVGPVYHKDRPGEADKFVNKIFTLNDKTIDMSQGIDWYAAAEGDLEWNGGLVRHGYFMLLAEEYRKTGDEKYAKTIIEHITDYIDKVPRYNPEGKPYLEWKKSTWRPFEVAARIAETWPEALSKIIGSKSMTPEVWAKILLSIHDQADFVSKYHWKTGNHACLETAALGIVGIFYQEFREAEAWRKYAVDFLMNMWPKQFFDDGYSREMSGGYQWVAMRNFFSFYEVALRNGFEDIFPPLYKERLIKNAYAELMQSKPDFTVPITNDSNILTNRREQLRRIAEALNIPEIRYHLSADDPAARKPEKTSYFFPDARVGIMRSDWSRDALYLSFDMGPWGDNHMNEDQLNIEVSAYGRNMLVNCGRWRYTTSPNAPWIAKAQYFKTTAAYNSVLVDGYCQVPGDAEGFMTSDDKWDYAKGIFRTGYGVEEKSSDEKALKEKGVTSRKKTKVTGVTHQREVFFVKPYFWIVRDRITGDGEHKAEQIWHFTPGTVVPVECNDIIGGKDFCYTTQFDDANLIIRTIGENAMEPALYCGSEEPFRGWHCPYYDHLVPAPELAFTQKGTGEIIFHTLIYPVKGKAQEIPEFRYDGGSYHIKYGGRTWTIDAPMDGSWKVG